jgi:U3 small nucleolar RNA-associated protein 19
VESDDPQTCNALDSCLWELKTLSNHYHPQVSDLINRLLDPEKQLEEEDLHVYLNLSAKEMLEKENEVTENVSVNFISPTGLWESWT